jgi:hypothetical protein
MGERGKDQLLWHRAATHWQQCFVRRLSLVIWFLAYRSVFDARDEEELQSQCVPGSAAIRQNRLHGIRWRTQIFRTGRLERELQMVQLSATRWSCIAILWVSLVTFSAITLCVASQWVFIAVYFFIDSVRKVLDTPSYITLDNVRYAIVSLG